MAYAVVIHLHAGIGGKARVDGQHYAGDGGGGLVVAQEEHAAQQLLALHIEVSNALPPGNVEVKPYGELRRWWPRCSRRKKWV